MTDATQRPDYPALLDFPVAQVSSNPPATVIAEKFQAMVALGVLNGRMKDYYDLWAIPRAVGATRISVRTAISTLIYAPTYYRRHPILRTLRARLSSARRGNPARYVHVRACDVCRSARRRAGLHRYANRVKPRSRHVASSRLCRPTLVHSLPQLQTGSCPKPLLDHRKHVAP